MSKSRNYSGNTTNKQSKTTDNSVENQKPTSLSCPKCAATKIAKSRPKGFDNLLIRFLPKRPYRCMHCYHRFWYQEKFTADQRRVWSWALLVGAIAMLVLLYQQSSSRQNTHATKYLTSESSSAKVPSQLVVERNSSAQRVNTSETILSNLEKRDLIEKLDFRRPLTAPVSEVELKRELAVAKQQEKVIQKINQQKRATLSDQTRSEPAEAQSLLKTELSYRVEQWRSAWQRGNSKQYLDFYDPSFSPVSNDTGNPVSLEAWREQRIARVMPDKSIQLKLTRFQVEFANNNTQAVVSFDQEYQSKSYKDISRKELTLTSRGDQWYIVAERTTTL